jgi:hypothetical protein
MTPEEIAKLQADLKAAQTQVETFTAAAKKTEQTAASLQSLVKPHADALRQCATSMLAAGIGADNTNGHAHHLNKMADTMEAEAVLGRVPCTYSSYMFGEAQVSAALQAQIATAIEAATKPLKDEISSLKTVQTAAEKKAAELAAAAAAGGKTAEEIAAAAAAAGGRKSLHPSSLVLLKRIGLNAESAGFKVAELDAACQKAGMTSADSIALKLNLKAAGILAA